MQPPQSPSHAVSHYLTQQVSLVLCLIQSTQALPADPLPVTCGAVSNRINACKPCLQTPYLGSLVLCNVHSIQALSADPLTGISGAVSHTINSSPVCRPPTRDLWHCVSYNQLKPCPQTPYQGPLVPCLIQSTQAPSIDSPNYPQTPTRDLWCYMSYTCTAINLYRSCSNS